MPRRRVEIQLVLPESPAEKAGLKPGDVVLEMDGGQVADEKAFSGVLDGLKAGQAVRVAVCVAGGLKRRRRRSAVRSARGDRNGSPHG